MANINLIPQDKKKTPQQSKLVHALRKVINFLVVIFVLIGAAGGGFWYFSNNELQTVTASVDDLKQQISSLQQSEGNLLLLRDRLDKAQGLIDQRKTYEALTYFSNLGKSLPEGVTMSDIRVEDGSNKLTLRASSSRVLEDIISQIAEADYENVTVENLNFSPSIGYSVVVSVL